MKSSYKAALIVGLLALGIAGAVFGVVSLEVHARSVRQPLSVALHPLEDAEETVASSQSTSTGAISAATGTGGVSHVSTPPDGGTAPEPLPPGTETAPDSPAVPLGNDALSILVVGDDVRTGLSGDRSDAVILAQLDPSTGRVWLLALPRDSRVWIPDEKRFFKLNDTYRVGGIEGLRDGVQRLTGIRADYHVVLHFQAVHDVVEALGGVRVYVNEAINDRKADASPSHSAATIAAGWQQLDGWHALTFARARHMASGGPGRVRNQRMLVQAAAEKLFTLKGAGALPQLVATLSKSVSTDMTLVHAIRLAVALAGRERTFYSASASGPYSDDVIWLDTAKLAGLVSDMQSGRPFAK